VRSSRRWSKKSPPKDFCNPVLEYREEEAKETSRTVVSENDQNRGLRSGQLDRNQWLANSAYAAEVTL